MILLPGPAFIMMLLGLGILATEFVWARTLLNKFKEKFGRITKTNSTDKTKQCVNIRCSGLHISIYF